MIVAFVSGLVSGAGAMTLVLGTLHSRANRKRQDREEFERALRIARTRRISVARPGTTPARVTRASFQPSSPSMRAYGTTEVP